MKVEKSGNFNDIKSLKAYIDGNEITSHINQINIYQDIFLPCWTSIVTIEDSSNILMRLPIKPGSTFKVDIETQTESIFDGNKSYEFIIYKLGDKIMKGQMHYPYRDWETR